MSAATSVPPRQMRRPLTRPCGRGLGLLAERDVSGEERALAGRAVHPKPAVEGSDPVAESDETAPDAASAADAVVAHLHQ